METKEFDYYYDEKISEAESELPDPRYCKLNIISTKIKISPNLYHTVTYKKVRTVLGYIWERVLQHEKIIFKNG